MRQDARISRLVSFIIIIINLASPESPTRARAHGRRFSGPSHHSTSSTSGSADVHPTAGFATSRTARRIIPASARDRAEEGETACCAAPVARPTKSPCGGLSTGLPKSSAQETSRGARASCGWATGLWKDAHMIARPSRSTPVSLATTPPSRAESRRRGKYIRHRAEGDDLPVPALSTYSTSTSDLVHLFWFFREEWDPRAGCFRSRSRSQLLALGSCRQPCARARLPSWTGDPRPKRTPAKRKKKQGNRLYLHSFLISCFLLSPVSCVALAPMSPSCDSLSRIGFRRFCFAHPLRSWTRFNTSHHTPLARLLSRRRDNSRLALQIPITPIQLFRHAPRHPGHLPRHSAPEAGHDVLGYARPGGPRHVQKVHAERAYTHISRLFCVLPSPRARERNRTDRL